MARMIPSHISADTSPRGELIVFSALAGDPASDGWVVLHSLDLPDHVRQIEGEVDFVVIVPGQGVLCLEVKSHTTIARDPSGIWHLGQEPPSERGPFKQAREGMHSLVRQLKRARPDLSGIPFTYGVCTPRCNFNVSATEWHPWQVIDAHSLASKSLVGSVTALLTNARDHFEATDSASWFDPARAEPSSEQVEIIARTLRGKFEVHQSPKARRAERTADLRRYTEEQYGALDLCDANLQSVITGPAGTGKTFLAVEQARRAASQHERVLLLCYNRLLASWLESEFQPIRSVVTVTTLHSLMQEIVGQPVFANASSGYWREQLPESCIDELLGGHPLVGVFGSIIVDEAQDLLHGPYLDVLDLLGSKGLDNTSLVLFGDLQKQAIFSSVGGSPLAVLSECLPSIAHLPLRVNCRNTPRIGDYIAKLTGAPDLYRNFRRPDDGVSPITDFWSSSDDQKSMLTAYLDQLLQEGFRVSEIVVLSMRRDGSAASLLSPPWSQRLNEIYDASRQKGGYSTVAAFKGLEAPAVVVTDIEQVSSEFEESLLYIALSRATDRLILLASPSARDDLWSMFSRPMGGE